MVTLGVTETISWGVLYYAFTVYLAPMEAELGWSRGDMTGAFSLAVLLAGLAAIPVGRWLDRHGPRLLMTVGSVAATLLVLAWSNGDAGRPGPAPCFVPLADPRVLAGDGLDGRRQHPCPALPAGPRLRRDLRCSRHGRHRSDAGARPIASGAIRQPHQAAGAGGIHPGAAATVVAGVAACAFDARRAPVRAPLRSPARPEHTGAAGSAGRPVRRRPVRQHRRRPAIPAVAGASRGALRRWRRLRCPAQL